MNRGISNAFLVSSERTERADPHHTEKSREEDIPSVLPGIYFQLKEFPERMLGALLFVPASVAIAVLWLSVRLSSEGPGIYRQVRVGRHGRHFTMYKLRTMAFDAESSVGAVWTQRNDSRVTGFGAFLRRTHLDELPQLVNVIRGEMALFGPRPERPEFVAVLAKQVPGYLERLKVLPGITGLAQINLEPDTDLDSVRRKTALDLEYIRIANAWLDFRMFLATLCRLFGLPGTFVIRLTQLQRNVVLPPRELDLGDDDGLPVTPSLLEVAEE